MPDTMPFNKTIHLKHELGKCNPFQWRIQDFPLGGGGADPLGGANLQRVHFLAKTKEIDPVGGGARAPPDPPMRFMQNNAKKQCLKLLFWSFKYPVTSAQIYRNSFELHAQNCPAKSTRYILAMEPFFAHIMRYHEASTVFVFWCFKYPTINILNFCTCHVCKKLPQFLRIACPKSTRYILAMEPIFANITFYHKAITVVAFPAYTINNFSLLLRHIVGFRRDCGTSSCK